MMRLAVTTYDPLKGSTMGKIDRRLCKNPGKLRDSVFLHVSDRLVHVCQRWWQIISASPLHTRNARQEEYGLLASIM